MSRALLLLPLLACDARSPLAPTVAAHCRAEAAAVRAVDPAEVVALRNPLAGTERAAAFCYRVRRASPRADALFSTILSAAQAFDESFKRDPAAARAALDRLAAAFDELDALPLAE